MLPAGTVDVNGAKWLFSTVTFVGPVGGGGVTVRGRVALLPPPQAARKAAAPNVLAATARRARPVSNDTLGMTRMCGYQVQIDDSFAQIATARSTSTGRFLLRGF